MAKKSSLFLLIRSLSKAEKRYFKLFAAMNRRNKNYLLLFDAIDRQAAYDEEALKKKFKKHAFTKQLHVTKNYLNKLIMKSLRNFHAQSSKEAALKGLLKDVEILFRRELYAQCRQTLQKAELIANKYEKFVDLLEILAWKRRLNLNNRDHIDMQNNNNALIETERATLQKLIRLNDYWRLTNNIFEVINTAREKGRDRPDDQIPHLLLQNCDQADSLRAKTLYYFCLQSYHFFNRNFDNATRAAGDLIALLEAHPHRIQDDPAAYIAALNNRVGICLHQKDYATAVKLLAKIRAIPQKYGLKRENPATAKLILQTFNMELEMYRDTRDLQKGIALAEKVSAFLSQIDENAQQDYRLVIYYQFAYLHFLNRSFDQSLHWLNEVFQRKFQTPREDILSYAQLLRLIIHFELGNTMVLKYAVESCRRFLKKKRELHTFERALLKFFSKASMALPAEVPELFRQLDDELFAGMEERGIRSVCDYLDVKGWLAQKLARFAHQ